MPTSEQIPSFEKLRNRIRAKLGKTVATLRKAGYKCEVASSREFYDYLTGETPTGDTTTIMDVLANKYLLVHEVVETSELRKIGIPLNTQTVMTFHPNVYEAHFKALEVELDHAMSKKDYEWVRARISLASSWLEDNLMPKQLIPKCKALMKKFSNIPQE